MNIDIFTLKNEINILKTQFYNTKSKTEKLLIYKNLIKLCDAYNLLTDYEYNSDISFLTNHKDFKKYNRLICKNTNISKSMKSYYYNASKNILKLYKETEFNSFSNIISSTNPNGLDIIFDFFNQYDKESYYLINSMFDNNQIEIKNLNDGLVGTCYNISTFNKSYILCDLKYFDINDLAGLVHELGHALYFNHVNYLSKSTNYIEVPSMFFMKAFLDFTFKNKINLDETNQALNVYYRRTLRNFAGLCLDTEPLNNKINSNSIFNDIQMALKQCDSKNIENDIKLNIKYSYGSLIGLYFADQYKKDPELGKMNINNYMSEMVNKSDRELLNTCGLNEDELANPQILKKELLNNMLKK